MEMSEIFKNIALAAGQQLSALATNFILATFQRISTKHNKLEDLKASIIKGNIQPLIESGEMTMVELCKCKNIIKIAQEADKIISKRSQGAGAQELIMPDSDWLMRFFDYASNISNDELQTLWAKILAGEVKQPSSFSLKTLDTLRSMSQGDAELFLKVCAHSPASGSNRFLPNYNEYLNAESIEYDNILKLSELGLIFGNEGIIISIRNASKNPTIRIYSKDCILNVTPREGSSSQDGIMQYPFTSSGLELAKISEPWPSIEDLIQLAHAISNMQHYETSVHKIISRQGDYTTWERLDLSK